MRDDQPSNTATSIAASLTLLRHRRDAAALVREDEQELYRIAVHEVGGTVSGMLKRCERSEALRRIARFMHRRLAAGFALHVATRKRAIESQVLAALETGCSQLVVVAAGFDTLAPRLAQRHPAVRCVELDHPATQRFKLAALRRAGPMPPNLFLHAADLSRVTLGDALAASAGFDRATATVMVVEGLLMYLTPEQVRGLLCAAAGLPNSEVRLIATFMEPRADGRIGFANQSALVDWWLRRSGEPMQSAVSPEGMAALLHECGWGPASFFRAQDLAELARAICPGLKHPLAQGESIAMASRNVC